MEELDTKLAQEKSAWVEKEQKLATAEKDHMDALRLLKATREKQLIAKRDLKILQ